MKIVTVDLDDTLMKSNIYYNEARKNYANYLCDKFDFKFNHVINKLQYHDENLFDEMGISDKRFPKSFMNTAEDLLSDKDVNMTFEIEKAQRFGLSVYKSESTYKEDGFITGAKELLNLLNNKYNSMHLITSGVPKIQNPKIKALELENWFNEIHITNNYDKTDTILEIKNNYNTENLVHIGNSGKSDIQSALNADVNAIYIPNAEWLGNNEYDYESMNQVLVFDSIKSYINYLKN